MELTVPGDKSISQRALLLAALAEGRSHVSGLLHGGDPASMAAVLRRVGVDVPELPPDGSAIEIVGRGLQGLGAAGVTLDCGNSGTAARLLLGVFAGQSGHVTVTGDASLRGRPMHRVTGPLTAMGARFEELGEDGRLPIRVHGGPLRPLNHDSATASAQVKSAILLAGLVSGTGVTVTQPTRSRDHTERLLARVGAEVACGPVDGRWWVELEGPPGRIRPLELQVPGDFSSAAFFLALGLLGGCGNEIVIRNVGLNPTRTGLLDVVARMGAGVRADPRPEEPWGEPTGRLTVAPTALKAVEVGGDEIVGLIDEVPVLAVLAARASGVTRITGAAELRLKETDRLRALARNLASVGVRVEELDDGLEIEGTDGPLRGRVEAFHDHRIAMAFGVLGALPGNEIEVDDPAVADVSFPGFWTRLGEASASVRRFGAATDVSPSGRPATARRRRPIVTIDGPAGSGKSSTAKAVARQLGFRHLDSGALYRAITLALLKAGVDPSDWPGLDAADLAAYRVDMTPSPDGFVVTVAGRSPGGEIRTAEVTAHVSRAAGLPAVRGWLLNHQRHAGEAGGLVADGRDMGTVVFPDAEVKVFLTADLAERARRRLLQATGQEPEAPEVGEEARRIETRDAEDSEREISPLRRAEDAVVLDTTALTMEEQVREVVRLVDALTTP